MHLNKRTRIQLAVFLIVTLVAGAVMIFGYMRLPATLFGVGRYTVTVELPVTGGLYGTANVTYRGAEIGKVDAVTLTDTGVEATLSLSSDTDIPADVDAQVHSRSAVGEQYLELIPRNGNSAPLQDGDVIPLERTSVPPDIATLLDTTEKSLAAIPKENLSTVIDESYNALNGTGPQLSRLLDGASSLSGQARENLDPLLTLIDQSAPVLQSQADTTDSITQWAAHLEGITGQIRDHDAHVRAILKNAAPSADHVNALLGQVKPTLPVLLANLVSIGDVAVTYQRSLEQLLVLLPQGTAVHAATLVPNLGTDQPYKGAFLSFNLNLNNPPPCTTGYLPADQRRSPVDTDYPDRPQGDLYCRVPQDSPHNVRGARNNPCTTTPGVRAPTVAMCESGEPYVPLNDGTGWTGDPNATTTGQSVPQPPVGASVTPSSFDATGPPGTSDNPSPQIATADYDPDTGTYVGPDGRAYTQTNLAVSTAKEKTWQTMMQPTA